DQPVPQPLAGDESRAAHVEVEIAEHPTTREAACELLDFVQSPGRVAPADDRADRRTGHDVRHDTGLEQRTKDADVRPSPRRATPECQADLHLRHGSISAFPPRVAPERGWVAFHQHATRDRMPETPPWVESLVIMLTRAGLTGPYSNAGGSAYQQRRRWEIRLSLTFSRSGGHESDRAALRTLRRQGPVEAGPCARMARLAVTFDVALEPQHVLVAVPQDFGNSKQVPALLALLPDPLSRA